MADVKLSAIAAAAGSPLLSEYLIGVTTGNTVDNRITFAQAAVTLGLDAGGGLKVGTTPLASATNTAILYDNGGTLGNYTITGTGTVAVMQNTPTLTTPVLGVATATSINKVAITAPATSATLTIADGKTLTASRSLTLTGTDTTTMTFPASSAAVAALDLASQAVTGGASVTSLTQAAGNITVNPGLRPLQYQTNSGAFTITAPAADGSMILLLTNDGTAGAVTFSGFSVGSNTGDALTTTNTNKFSIHIWRINGVSGYRIAAHQ